MVHYKEAQSERISLRDLPSELILMILDYLPPKDFECCILASRELRNTSQYLLERHRMFKERSAALPFTRVIGGHVALQGGSRFLDWLDEIPYADRQKQLAYIFKVALAGHDYVTRGDGEAHSEPRFSRLKSWQALWTRCGDQTYEDASRRDQDEAVDAHPAGFADDPPFSKNLTRMYYLDSMIGLMSAFENLDSLVISRIVWDSVTATTTRGETPKRGLTHVIRTHCPGQIFPQLRALRIDADSHLEPEDIIPLLTLPRLAVFVSYNLNHDLPEEQNYRRKLRRRTIDALLARVPANSALVLEQLCLFRWTWDFGVMNSLLRRLPRLRHFVWVDGQNAPYPESPPWELPSPADDNVDRKIDDRNDDDEVSDSEDCELASVSGPELEEYSLSPASPKPGQRLDSAGQRYLTETELKGYFKPIRLIEQLLTTHVDKMTHLGIALAASCFAVMLGRQYMIPHLKDFTNLRYLEISTKVIRPHRGARYTLPLWRDLLPPSLTHLGIQIAPGWEKRVAPSIAQLLDDLHALPNLVEIRLILISRDLSPPRSPDVKNVPDCIERLRQRAAETDLTFMWSWARSQYLGNELTPGWMDTSGMSDFVDWSLRGD